MNSWLEDHKQHLISLQKKYDNYIGAIWDMKKRLRLKDEEILPNGGKKRLMANEAELQKWRKRVQVLESEMLLAKKAAAEATEADEDEPRKQADVRIKRKMNQNQWWKHNELVRIMNQEVKELDDEIAVVVDMVKGC